MTKMTKTIRILMLAGLIPLATAACSDVLSLDVEAPGRIADDDLNTVDAIPGIVAGMAYDLSQAVDGTLQQVNMAGGEIWHGGSYDWGTYPRGLLLQEPADWDGEYGTISQARWVAENGLKRIEGIIPDTYERDPYVAQGYLYAGFANRLMGELQCTGTVDGGPEVPRSEFFVRADSMFSRAIQVGGAAGVDEVVTAGYGGRASVRAWRGDWTGAASDAQRVPVGFQYDVIFSLSVGAVSNDFVFETTNRKEYTVFSTMWEDYPDDARVPWRIVYDASGEVEKGQDGETDFYQQLKYRSQDDDIALTKGTEMLMLLAEGQLRAGNIGAMTDYLNQARVHYGMDLIDPPGSTAEAWEVMRFERYATMWLEGRRLNDLHRFEADGGVIADPFSQGRDTCFPISDEESRVNPNL